MVGKAYINPIGQNLLQKELKRSAIVESLNKHISVLKKRESGYLRRIKQLEDTIVANSEKTDLKSEFQVSILDSIKYPTNSTPLQSQPISFDDMKLDMKKTTTLKNLMNEDLHALIQNLQESNADMKSQYNSLSIKLKKQKQRNVQQAAMIKRYRKIIDETSGPHKEKSNTDINQNNSENADSGTIDFKTVTLMKISNLTSSISEHEQDCSVLQNTKLKYITNEPVFASLEPVLKNIMKCSTLYELFYNATIQVKKLIHCKLCTVFVFNNRIVKLSKQDKAKMVQIVHDNKWIDAMSEVDSKIGDP